MPRPAKPVAGTEIRHEFGQALVDYAGEPLRFRRVVTTTAPWVLNNVVPVAGPVNVEATRLPANDPKVKFAEVLVMIRGAANDNTWAAPIDIDGNRVGEAYTTGTTIGGMAGPFRVKVGGVNNRSFTYLAGAITATSRLWIAVVGWWETGA